MFEGFANVWSPVTLARNLKPGKPLAVELAGEKLVFFRSADGSPVALMDQCPHRGVQLSLGTVTPGGCLACPFHAWEFGKDGVNQHVPLNPDAKRERLGAMSLAVREVGGLLYVFTAPGVQPTVEPMVPDTLTMPGLSRTFLELTWKAHWTRAMENMLDSPHVPFVHRTTIGRTVSKDMTRQSNMDITWEDTPYGGRTTSALDGNTHGGAFLDFYKPNIMVLHIPIPGKVFKMHALCIPAARNHVRMIIIGARNFATPAVLNPFFQRSNAVIAEQDRKVVESSFPVEVPPAGDEVSVKTDRATLAFRKFYYAELKDSHAAIPAGHQHARLPVAG